VSVTVTVTVSLTSVGDGRVSVTSVGDCDRVGDEYR